MNALPRRTTQNGLRAAVVSGPAEVSLGPATKLVRLPDPFPFWRGGALRGGRVAYETWGELNEARDNAVLLFTGLSPSAHAASSPADPTPGWWEKMVGPGKALDTSRYFVVCVNSLGSCFGSTGPASIDAASGLRLSPGFPDLSVEDIARGGYETIRALKIEKLSAVVGASLGGMVVLAFAAQFPGAARRVVSISGSPAASPFAIALRSLQRDAILTDADWQEGQYAGDIRPVTGMRLARKLGTITYRSAAEWKHRFGRRPAAPAQEREFAAGPRAFRGRIRRAGLSERPGRQVRVGVRSELLSVPVARDGPVRSFRTRRHSRARTRRRGKSAGDRRRVRHPVHHHRAECDCRPPSRAAGTATEFVPLASLEGHDAFLVDIDPFSAAIGRFLAE